MKLSEGYTGLPRGVFRFFAFLAILIVGILDQVTGPYVSFLLFYVIPIAIIAWVDGRQAGIAFSALAALVRLSTEVFWWEDVSIPLHILNTLGRFVTFAGVAWIISLVQRHYSTRLEKAQEDYIRIVETAVEGVVATNALHVIRFANGKAATMFGLPVEQLVGKNILEMTEDAASKDILRNLLESSGSETNQPVQIRLKTDSGSLLWALVNVTAASSTIESEEFNALLLTDLTELKKTEQALRTKYREISALQRLSSVLVQSLELETQLKVSLDTVLAVTSYTGGAIYLSDTEPDQFRLRIKRDTPSLLPEILKATLAQSANVTNGDGLRVPLFVPDLSNADSPLTELFSQDPDIKGYAALPITSKDQFLGILLLLSHSTETFPKTERHLLQTFGNQIGIALETARLYEAAKQREEKVVQLTFDLVNLQEEERRRFARELHDSLSGTLTTLKINSELALKMVHTDPLKVGHYLSEVALLADEAQQEARTIANDLRPSLLDDFGLYSAIRQHAATFERRCGIRVELLLPASSERFDPVIETTVYRIIQELLANVARHSGAERVMIQILERDGELAVSVHDNGRGLPNSNSSQHEEEVGHFGLRNIRERVELLNGSFRAESSPGSGVECILEIPVKAAGKVELGHVAHLP